MALPQPQQGIRYYPILLTLTACLAIVMPSCREGHKTYKSDCDDGVHFKQVSFTKLMDSIQWYDLQYVEVTGKYREDKELSALFCDSLPDNNALWVNFSQDCPLYLKGTHQGLFEYNNGQFTQINNRSITIRGRIDVHNKGSRHNYKATIDRISLVKL